MTDVAPPRRYVVRKPGGDPGAARRLATAYDALGGAVRADVRRASAVLNQLGSDWFGVGALGSTRPADMLGHDGARVASALEHSAADLRHYAQRLAKAHEHHGWSLGRLVALGATLTVGVAAVVVTVGAAAPAEAAAAAAAVDAADAAATAAGTASTGVAGALAQWQGVLAAVRPLAPFVVPHLVSAGGSTALELASDLVTGRSVDAHALEVAAAIGFTGSAAAGAVENQLAQRSSLLRRLAESGSWAATGTAGAYADDGAVDPLDSVAVGLTGFIARDIRLGVDRLRDAWTSWRERAG